MTTQQNQFVRQKEIYLEEELSSEEETTNQQELEEDEEEDKESEQVTERMPGKRPHVDYDDENAADIEDADRADDDEEEEDDEEDENQVRSIVGHHQYKEDMEQEKMANEQTDKKKFHFQMGGNKQQSNTVYGGKHFIDFRTTFMNQASSNKVLSLAQQQPAASSSLKQAYVTHYGGEGFNKRGSLSGDNYGNVAKQQ